MNHRRHRVGSAGKGAQALSYGTVVGEESYREILQEG